MSDFRVRAYYANQLPGAWIVEREGTLLIVDARANGWESRRSYHGFRESLREVNPQMLFGIGIPDDLWHAAVKDWESRR